MIQIVRQRGGFIHCVPNPIICNSVTELFEIYDTKLLPLMPAEEHVNIYYTLAHHVGADKPSNNPIRTAASFERQDVLAWDIDGADGSRWEEYADALAGIFDLKRDAFTVVGSGNGLHLLINLRYPIHQVKYFKENKAAYNEICSKLGDRMVSAGLGGKVDPVIFEPARVLRVPGTKNVKPNKRDTECELLQLSILAYDINMRQVSGLEKAEAENISPVEVRRQFPQPDFPYIVEQCEFVKWCLDKTEEVHEPHVFDLFSLLVNMPPDATVLRGGVSYTAKGLAEEVFKNATASKSLARSIFEDKWQQSARYGARKCSTIEDHWGQCKTCAHFGKCPTPLALKSSDHIGSEANGYWVINSKGQCQYPHYSDLSKIYKRERSFVVTSDERLFAFDGSHYEETPDLMIKKWVETKMHPSDPLREHHRVEFYKKLLAVGGMSPKAEMDLFEASTAGKLNFTNGVLDIATGELLTPSPNFGFKYVLPYEYKAGDTSEFFLDWLSQIMESQVELIELVLDVMAYCIWPNFDEHVLTYLVGDGSNGKSTLINVIREIVGPANHTSVSMHQLTTNRFAPAELEGKLMNLSEESGGSDLSGEQLNTIKNLSAGGEMYIERKGQQGYKFRNKAKLLFSANKPPRFAETGLAITRRLLVIPFGYIISTPDSSIEDRLKAEAPSILSMLIARIQENTSRNAGKFLINRNYRLLEEEQKKFLSAGNTSVTWARENLVVGADVPSDSFVVVDEAYKQYLDWCEDNGMRTPANKLSFSKHISDYILCPGISEQSRKNIKHPDGGWKTHRIFTRTKFAEGATYGTN